MTISERYVRTVEDLTSGELDALGIRTSLQDWPSDYRWDEWDRENDAIVYWSAAGEEIDGSCPVIRLDPPPKSQH